MHALTIMSFILRTELYKPACMFDQITTSSKILSLLGIFKNTISRRLNTSAMIDTTPGNAFDRYCSIMNYEN